MATVTCETIVKYNGRIHSVTQHTNKTFAKQYGANKVKRMGSGTYEVKPVTPYEFKPE